MSFTYKSMKIVDEQLRKEALNFADGREKYVYHVRQRINQLRR